MKKFLLLVLTAFVSVFALSATAYGADFDDVVFFGDSTTAHMAARGGIPARRVWSGRGSTVRFSTVNSERCVCLSDGRTLTLAEAVRSEKPRAIVVTLGVSGGVGSLSKSDFQEIYRKMLLSVREASPQTEIYVQSILPLSDKSVKYYKRITKEAVAEANLWIREVCLSMSIPYIDSHSLLTGKDGYLRPEYQNDEYMHLTASAYGVILSNIRKAVEK